MISIFLATAAMLQADGPIIGDDVPRPDIVKELAAPPIFGRVRAIDCGCAEAQPATAFLEGYVVDAKLTLGADGRSVNDVQATIFDLLNAPDGAPKSTRGRTPIYHSANEGQCGVTFDYGKKYRVPVRKTEDGKFQTDICLISGKAGKPAAPSTADDPAKSE